MFLVVVVFCHSTQSHYVVASIELVSKFIFSKKSKEIGHIFNQIPTVCMHCNVRQFYETETISCIDY